VKSLDASRMVEHSGLVRDSAVALFQYLLTMAKEVLLCVRNEGLEGRRDGYLR
jgi:hypothetical protein